MNVSTVIVALVLIAVIVLIIRSMLKDRKAGKNSCGHKCSGCAMAGQCHSFKSKEKNK